MVSALDAFHPPFPCSPFSVLNSSWHQLGRMLRTWARTKIVGTNVQDRRVWLNYLKSFGSGILQVCLANKISFPELSFPPSTMFHAVFFVCGPCLLTLWQPESSWIVREEWLFVLPTCCHRGFDCLSRQRGLRHNHSQTLTHIHPCGWTFLLARLPDGTAGSVGCGHQKDWLIDCVSNRLSKTVTEREGWRTWSLLFLPVQAAWKKFQHKIHQASTWGETTFQKISSRADSCLPWVTSHFTPWQHFTKSFSAAEIISTSTAFVTEFSS